MRNAAQLLLASVLLLPIAACGGDRSTVATEPEVSASPPAAAATPSAPTASVVATPDAGLPGADNSFDIVVADGAVTGDTGRLKVGVGESVALTVTSNQADEVHVHGYDLTAPVGPGQPAAITFDATIPGVFEIELEQAGTQLASLQVQ
jgi:hypothetical protein